MKRRYRYLLLFAIAAISTMEHFDIFSKDLIGVHVWRQAQTQSTIVNFYEEDMNIFNPRRNDRGDGDGIFRMEFPLMQWLVACTYKIFGNHLIITRIFVFITGLVSVLGFYRLLFWLFGNYIIALIGAWTITFSPSFYYYNITPLPDNLALCCSIWGMAMFFRGCRKNRISCFLISGILLSTGALCKLPFILYFVVPLTYFLMSFHKNGIKNYILHKALSILGFLILPAAWYISVVPHWQGNGIVSGILSNSVPFKTIIDYFQHNLISTLPELLLNYGSLIFFLAGFYFLIKKKTYKDSTFILLLALGIVLLAYFVFEINMIAKVHDYYLFPFLPLLFIMVSYGAYCLLNHDYKFFRILTIVLLLILPLTAYARIQGRWYVMKPIFNRDLLLYKKELRDAVPKKSLVVAGNDDSHFIFFYYIDKKGWGFDHDNLDAQKLGSMIGKGAEYLYMDSHKIMQDPEIKPMLDTLILEKGSIRVYGLRMAAQTK